MLNSINKKIGIFFICITAAAFLLLTLLNAQSRIKIIDLQRKVDVYISSIKKQELFRSYTEKFIGSELPRIAAEWQNEINVDISPYLLRNNRPFVFMIQSNKGCLSCFEIVMNKWAKELQYLTNKNKLNVAIIASEEDKNIIDFKLKEVKVKNITYAYLNSSTYKSLQIPEENSLVFFVDETGRTLFIEKLEISRIKALTLFMHKIKRYLEKSKIDANPPKTNIVSSANN